MTTEVDVIVIGAGLSGLVAARNLLHSGVEDVLVLEAREDVGGKCQMRPVGGLDLDIGGMFIGPGQTDLIGLVDSLGLKLHDVSTAGKAARWFGAEVEYVDAGEAVLPPAQQQELEAALERFSELCDRVPGASPWKAAEASELDLISVENWIRQQSDDPKVQHAIARCFKTGAASPSQMSMLAFAGFVASCGGWQVFAQELEWLVEGGAGQITELIADELGDRVHTGWPVTSIRPNDIGVEVVSPSGTVRARRVIIAMSPADARHIHFRTRLTTQRQLLHRAWFAASITKTMLVYDRPFWREATDQRPALSGFATNDHGGPHTVLDTSPPDSSVGVLAAMIRLLGDNQRFGVPQHILDDATARRQLLLESLEAIYGPEASTPRDVFEMHWFQEPYISGCLGWAPPGLLTQAGTALREPSGVIHWAGSETADVWINHLSGAVQAGQRAAREVLEHLRVKTSR